MAGIQQTDDVVKALGAFALFVREALSDGFQLTDLRDALEDENLRGRVIEAVRDAGDIPGEIADLDLTEIVRLGMSAAQEFQGVGGSNS